MATHVIEIDPFNPFSIIAAERQARQLISDFNRKVDEFIREIAEIGARAARGAYGSAVTVTVDEIDNGLAINANGKAVVFMEFGAGSAVDSSNRFASVVEQEGGFDIRPGSWSEQHAHQYERLGYWVFGGQRYYEVQPVNGMEKAYEAIMQDMRNAATKVFG